jgi:transposase
MLTPLALRVIPPDSLLEPFQRFRRDLALCYNRFVRWRRAGVWGKIMNALARAHDAAVQMSTVPASLGTEDHQWAGYEAG